MLECSNNRGEKQRDAGQIHTRVETAGGNRGSGAGTAERVRCGGGPGVKPWESAFKAKGKETEREGKRRKETVRERRIEREREGEDRY